MKVIPQKRFRYVVPGSVCHSSANLDISKQTSRIQCRYINNTGQFQIVRVANVSSSFLERTVMPYSRIVFEANQEDYLEVHSGNPISSILSDKIPCHRLAYQEEHPQ